MIGRAIAVWAGIAVLATLNGMFREVVLVPLVAPAVAQLVSGAMLTAIILAVVFAAIRWITPDARRDRWTIGLLWLALTVAFDLVLGSYESGRPLRAVAEGLGLSELVIFAVTLMAPAAAAERLRRAS